MAIDIKQVNTNSNSRVTSLSTGKSAAASSGAAGARVSSDQIQGDSVSITSDAQKVQNIETKLNAIPEVDAQKVAEIKAAIAEGRYKVDPEKLASNIAQFEHELKDLN